MVGHFHRRPRECHPAQPGDTQAQAGLTKIDSDFLLPHPEPVWSWLQTLQLAISRIICSSSPACPAPHRSASSSHPHPALCPGILYGPPAASIIWTGGEAFDLLNQRIPSHHHCVCEHADERERQSQHMHSLMGAYIEVNKATTVFFFCTNHIFTETWIIGSLWWRGEQLDENKENTYKCINVRVQCWYMSTNQ